MNSWVHAQTRKNEIFLMLEAKNYLLALSSTAFLYHNSEEVGEKNINKDAVVSARL